MLKALRRVLALVVAVTLLGGALAPAAHAAAAHLHWTPSAHALGAIIVPPGQTATANVSFVSNVVLTNAQVAITLDGAAQQRGVSISALFTSLPAGGAVAAGRPINVSFTVAAAANTTVGDYGGHVRVLASTTGSAQVSRLPDDLDITIRVPHVRVTWAGGPGQVVLLPGQSATLAVSFTSATALTNPGLTAQLDGALTKGGVTLSVTPATLPGTIPAGTAQTLTIVLTAPAAIHPLGGSAEVRVLTADTTGKLVQVPDSLHLDIHIPGPQVSWAGGGHVAFAAIAHTATAAVSAAKTVSFTSNVALTNVAVLLKMPADAQAHGVTVTAAPLASTRACVHLSVWRGSL
jgi:hypothetical protein